MTLDLEVRIATESEIQAAQDLDDAAWEGGFQRYSELHHLYPSGIRIAATDEVLGYIGAERLHEDDLRVGASSSFTKSMPPWDHDPQRWHRPDGNVLYILGHAVKPEYWKHGVSEAIMDDFLCWAREQDDITRVAVIYHLRHPTLANPLKFWGKHGFMPVLETYDPNWKYAADKKEVGGIIFALETR